MDGEKNGWMGWMDLYLLKAQRKIVIIGPWPIKRWMYTAFQLLTLLSHVVGPEGKTIWGGTRSKGLEAPKKKKGIRP